jgi:hypothetical protein
MTQYVWTRGIKPRNDIAETEFNKMILFTRELDLILKKKFKC